MIQIEYRCLCGAHNVTTAWPRASRCWNCGRVWGWTRLNKSFRLLLDTPGAGTVPITDPESQEEPTP